MKAVTTKDDMDAEYHELEHEYFIARSLDRPIDPEFTQRAMELLHKYYNHEEEFDEE